MKKIGIYYFSGTGNTWWISKELQRELIEATNQVTFRSIETLVPQDVLGEAKDLDHIVFSFPAYGSTAPKLMLKFLHNFPHAAAAQSISVVVTHALASGDTAYHISKILTDKGYIVRQTIHFRMMNNLHIPKFKFIKPQNDERVHNLHLKTLPKVKKLALMISLDKTYIIGKGFLGSLLGNLQRHHVDHFVLSASHELQVDPTRCISCNKCQRICPTCNIQKSGETYLFDDHCMLCMRCYSHCPRSAILIGKDSFDTVKYPRYKGPISGFDINVLIKK